MSKPRSILIIAGEVSGDMHAAKLVERVQQEMAARGQQVRFWGIGGDEMQAAGVELCYHVRDMAVLGLSEVLRRYGFFRRVFHDMLARLDNDPPDALLLVDYPGFNLRFAKKAKARGFKVLYYISPQVWAWKASRIPKMAACIDHLMVILPFEVDCFKGHDLKVNFVGHPLIEETAKALAAQPKELPWGDGEGTRLALLPGSRDQEIERILPVFVETVKKLPGVRPIIAATSEEAVTKMRTHAPDLPVVAGQAREVLRQADFGLIASGTATLEAALMECPHVVVYKTAALTWFVGKRLVKLPYIGLVNIIAGEELSREFLQSEAHYDVIAPYVSNTFGESAKLAAMTNDLRIVRKLLQSSPDMMRSEVIVADHVS